MTAQPQPKRTLIILGTIPLWPLLLIVGVCYGAMRCMVYLQTGSWTQ